jgi:hypothetical protein
VVGRTGPEARNGARSPELENGDRGGWPPFSKHRCLGRGGVLLILQPGL